MSWEIGTTVTTNKGIAKVIALTNTEATLQLEDGSTRQFPNISQEKIEVKSSRHYHKKTKKAKQDKPQPSPAEKESELLAIIAKAKATLNVLKKA